MTKHRPASPRSVWGAGFALGLGLLALAYFTHWNVHNLWEIPIGLYLTVMCLGKVSSR